MLRLLGILTLGSLVFGGRRRRRSLRRGLLFGALIGYLAGRNTANTARVKEDVRRAGDSVREAVRTARKEFRDGYRAGRKEQEERIFELQAQAEARRVAQAAQAAVPEAPAAVPADGPTTEELVADLERDARTAAMAADVPTIEFPEEDDKYNASRKYGYV